MAADAKLNSESLQVESRVTRRRARRWPRLRRRRSVTVARPLLRVVHRSRHRSASSLRRSAIPRLRPGSLSPVASTSPASVSARGTSFHVQNRSPSPSPRFPPGIGTGEFRTPRLLAGRWL